MYTKITFDDFESFYDTYIKEPYVCHLNVVPPNDGRVIIAPGNGNSINSSPIGCQVVDTKHRGGTILVFEDGITLFFFGKTSPKWSKTLVKYLISRGLDASLQGNDVLVDGCKVSGYMERCLENSDLNFYGIHISINTNVRLIEEVCQKPIVKIPRGLSYWGVTRKDVMEALNIEE